MASEDLAEQFLAMLAAERGAAANTLAAYRRDLDSARAALGDLGMADRDTLARLGEAWSHLAASSLARKCSALRQFYGFLVDEGLRGDDPSGALPRPRPRRPLPRLLSHEEIERFFLQAEEEAENGRPESLRLLALLELLYGSGLRASELVSLPLAAVPRDAPFFACYGQGRAAATRAGEFTRARVAIPVAFRASRWIEKFVSIDWRERTSHPRTVVPDASRTGDSRANRSDSGIAACLAPCLCDSSPGRRSRLEGFADPVGSCRYRDYANLHTR